MGREQEPQGQQQKTFYTINDIRAAVPHLKPSSIATAVNRMTSGDPSLVHHRDTGKGNSRCFDEKVFNRMVEDLNTRHAKPRRNGDHETVPSENMSPAPEPEQCRSLKDLGFTTNTQRTTAGRILANHPGIIIDHREGGGRGTRMFDHENSRKLVEAHNELQARKGKVHLEAILSDRSELPREHEGQLCLKVLDILAKAQQEKKPPIALQEIASSLFPNDSSAIEKAMGVMARLRKELENSLFQVESQPAYILIKVENSEKPASEQASTSTPPDVNAPASALPSPPSQDTTEKSLPPEREPEPQQFFRLKDLFGGEMTNSQRATASNFLKKHRSGIQIMRLESKTPGGRRQIFLDKANFSKLKELFESRPKREHPERDENPEKQNPDGDPPEEATTKQQMTIWQNPNLSHRQGERFWEGRRKLLEIDVARMILGNFARDDLRSVQKNIPRLLSTFLSERENLTVIISDNGRSLTEADQNNFFVTCITKALDNCLDPNFKPTSQKEQGLAGPFKSVREELAKNEEKRAKYKKLILQKICEHFKIGPTFSPVSQSPTD